MCVCVLIPTPYASHQVCAIWPSLWPCPIYTLPPVWLSPLPSPCSCRLNIRDHCGYVIAACHRPCRALRCMFFTHCTVLISSDSIYILASVTPTPPLLTSPAALSGNGKCFLSGLPRPTVDGGLNSLYMSSQCIGKGVLLKACKKSLNWIMLLFSPLGGSGDNLWTQLWCTGLLASTRSMSWKLF